jgi:hypothetical protein
MTNARAALTIYEKLMEQVGLRMGIISTGISG